MHLALGQLGDDLGALLGAGGFQDLAAGDDDVAAPAIHLEDLEGLRRVHQRADVAHRAHVHLAAGQEGHGAVEVDGEAALDLVEDDALDLLLVVELLLEPRPALLAARLLARQHGLAERVLDALQVHLDGVADLQLLRLARYGELAQRHAAFHLQADVDHGQVLLDGRDLALARRCLRRRRLATASRSAARRSRRAWGSCPSYSIPAIAIPAPVPVRLPADLGRGSSTETGNAAADVPCTPSFQPVPMMFELLPAARPRPTWIGAHPQVRPRWPTFFVITPTAVSNAASISKLLVSSKTASAAGRMGAASRLASRSSRRRISARTAS